jgi:hypothetical protein
MASRSVPSSDSGSAGREAGGGISRRGDGGLERGDRGSRLFGAKRIECTAQ